MRIGGGSVLMGIIALLCLATGGLTATAPRALPFSTNAFSITTVDALWQQITNSGYPVTYAGTTNDSKTFRGVFTTSSANTKLAIHSDDGSTVTVDGQGAGVDDLGTDTHLKERGSLKSLSTTFVPGQEYCVEINYSNSALTTNDQDGVTLYAYNGSGSVRVGPIIRNGRDALCLGQTLALSAECGVTPYQWSSSNTNIATVNASGLVTGLKSAMSVTITLTDGQTNSTTLLVNIVKPGISPGSLTTCVGVNNTFVVTNAAGTGAVTWSQSGTLSANGRTNLLTFGSPGTFTLTANYAGCSSTSSVVVVGVASLTANATNFCGSGTVIYTATSDPAGYESQLTWGGEALAGTGARRTNTYSTIGPHIVSVSCGTSVKYATNIVYRMDIAQSSATLLADATAPVTLNLTNSYGTPVWQIMPSGGAAIGGSGSTITITSGSVGTNYTLTACASEQPSCCDTAAVQVVKVTFNTNLVDFCEGTNATIKISITPTNAPALTFDTVTNVATGTANTVATVSVSNGTNMTITPIAPGTATLRVRLGNSTSFGPVIKVVRVTFPTNVWYVGEGKPASFTVSVQPPDAPVTYTTKESSIATASGSGSNLTVTGVALGATRVIALVAGVGCVDKDVTVARVTFNPTNLYICVGQSAQSTATVTPGGLPVTYDVEDPTVASLAVSGNTLTVTALTYNKTFVHARLGGSILASLPIQGVRVDFDTNAFAVLQGGTAVLKSTVYPDLDVPVMFESSNTNVARIVTLTGGPRRSDLTVVGVTNGFAQITARIGTNQLCASKAVLVAQLGLEAVQFIGLNRFTVLKDDGSGAYPDVYHWTKLTNSPLAYVRNTHPIVSAMVSILPAGVTNVFLIKGDGAYPIPPSSATPSGGLAVSAPTASQIPLPNQIDVIKPLIINWSASFDNGATFLALGASSNTTYVTWANSLNPIHTLLDVGCLGAQGVSGTEQNVLDAIWSNKILTKNIHRASDGRTLSYYGFLDVNGNGIWNAGVDTDFNSPGTCSITDAVGLIREGNGQCHSWADFLLQTMRSQGITHVGGNAVSIQGLRIKGLFNSFAVKNWAISGSSPRMITSFAAGIDGLSAMVPTPSASEAADAPGATGQGNSPNPPSRFGNHYIVRIGGVYYDPSYALGPFTDRKKYETSALAGRIAGNELSDAPADDGDPANHNDEINDYP